MKKRLFAFLPCVFFLIQAFAQEQTVDPFLIQSIQVKGARLSNVQTIKRISGLQVGQSLYPGGDIAASAIKNLWRTQLFSDIQIKMDTMVGRKADITIQVSERNRISHIELIGPKKSQKEELLGLIQLTKGSALTAAKLVEMKRVIRNFYVNKGKHDAQVKITYTSDPHQKHYLQLRIDVQQGKKYKIGEITFSGNTVLSAKQLKRSMRPIMERSWWKVWQKNRFIQADFDQAKKQLVMAYQEQGYMDADILQDSVYERADGSLAIEMELFEGKPYYYRNISWAGNYTFSLDTLNKMLGIRTGDLYRPAYLDQRLMGDPLGRDISSLYLDDGYLFFRVQPIVKQIEGDSVDIELQMFEGSQATIGKVLIEGNYKTSDHVILRELRTEPGQKFSRVDLIRSQRELVALNYFDPQQMEIEPIPNQENGTVDIRYKVVETSSDQIQLQLGWSGRAQSSTNSAIGGGLVGTLQLVFNNFSTKRFFDPSAWKPIPMGDGQKLTLAFQSNGSTYKNFAFSFLEPWLGGDKPNSLGANASHQVFQTSSVDAEGNTSLFQNKIWGLGVDFSQRLSWPDDFFRSYSGLNYRYYDIQNPSLQFAGFEGEENAFIHKLSFTQTLSRSNIDAPLFPRSGSEVSLSVELTPPYSLFRGEQDYAELSDAQKFKFLEYHKWSFNSNWYLNFTGNFVLKLQADAGYLGGYSDAIGVPPFERFVLGGAGLGQGGILSGVQAVPLRGYAEQSFNNNNTFYPLYNRFVAEVRHPINIPNVPTWLLGFVEAGNGYQSFKDYNPFDLKRSAGLGIRVQVPMIGLLGLDWGYGFDTGENGVKSGSQFHFIFGQRF